MGALTISGAVVGATDMCAKIYKMVDNVSSVKCAPDTTRDILAAVKVTQKTLKSFLVILESKPAVPKAASSRLSIGVLADVVEDCVRTLDILQETVKLLPDPEQSWLALYERFQWVLSEKKLAKQLERLHRIQTCLHSMVVLFTGHACKEVAVVVAADVEANLPKFPLDLPRRQSDGPSKETAYHSMKTSSSECPRLPKFEFEAQLHESTLYRRARDSTCDGFPSASPSLNPLARPSHGLDIPSVISAVALPLTKEELSNPELYAFDPVPQSHISDRTVGHLTLHELQAIVAAQSRSAFAQCMAYTFQTVSKSSLDVRVGKHSSSAECEGSGAEEERLPVACMSSLYFNQDSQAWPSASEIGAQLSACAANGFLDEFLCSCCNKSLGTIVQSRRDHWTEHSIFCRPCVQQLKEVHSSGFCPCTSPTSNIYIKYYNFSASMSLVRCAACFSCCFGCSRPRVNREHKCQATLTQQRIQPSAASDSRRRSSVNSHHRNESDANVQSNTTATSFTRTVATSDATSVAAGRSYPLPRGLQKTTPANLKLLPSPPISPLNRANPGRSGSVEKINNFQPPAATLHESVTRGPETPPDSAQNTSQSESEGEVRLKSAGKTATQRPPPGHKPSGSRDYIMRIPEETCEEMMLRRTHKPSSSISKVYFKDRSSAEETTRQIGSPVYWDGRVLFHHDAGPCLKLLYGIPSQLHDKYRKGQFAIAGIRGLLDPFKCRACQRGVWEILRTSAARDRYLSYLMWCGRPEKCTAVDISKCWTCGCHKSEPTGKLHVGYLDALTSRVVVFCSGCFAICRDCRANSGSSGQDKTTRRQFLQQRIPT